MKKKLSIIGKGTAGSQAVIHFLRFMPDCDIYWHFDPSIPTQSVGEGSTLELPANLYQNLGFFNTDLKKVNGNFKTAIYKENWGASGKSFFHDFPPPGVSYHFSAVELQDYIFQKVKNKVNIVEENTSPEFIDSDFILNASGKPSNFDEFNISEYIPVNAAYVVQGSWDYPQFDYTLTIAKKHGWVFGIPLQNRCSIGYLYNSDITTEEEVAEDIQEVVDRYNLKPTKSPNRLSFRNYYRKENYQMDGRVAHSGNSSFFLEPIEATSIATMDKIQRNAFDIWNGYKTPEQSNKDYLSLLHETELVIMLHYAAGSSFKSDFWEFAQDRGIKKIKDSVNDERFKQMYELAKSILEMQFAPSSSVYPPYGPWWSGAFVQNLNGLKLHKIIDSIL